ncbi:uncharacterized protein LOC128395838 [Panonychus citri]|uniref:uncharacterized protein LOC128395838 n=1 Tax=Panonychus citri TaxID=50023 RepID=UPI002306F25F|nr:uncharacterized protein LOC128395838 [Panonychus citri]
MIMIKVMLIAPTYDRPGYKKANGFRTIIKVINKFVPILVKLTSLDCPENVQQLINETNQRSSTSPSNYVNSINGVLTILIELCNLTIDCHQNWSIIKDPKEKYLWLQRTYRYTYEKLANELIDYWTYHELFWYESSIRDYLSYTISAFTTLSKPPVSLLSLLCRRERGSRMTSIAWKGDPFFQTTVINLLDNPIVDNINKLFFKFSGISLRNIKIPRQKDWIIPFDGNPVVHRDTLDQPPTESFVTCDQIKLRLYQVDNLPPNGTVIIHIQGGGFMVDAHAVHASYIKSWLPQLSGAIVVNIDYSLSVRYPVALQEIVDSILWLVSPNNITEIATTLQFIPDNLIILGDSCGGYLGLAACAVLRDIKDLAPGQITVFPSSLVCLSPVMAPVNLNYSPSLLLSMLDPFLCPTLNLQVLSLYSTGITLDSECQSTIDLSATVTMSSSSSSSSSESSSPIIGYVKESLWFTLGRCLFGRDVCWFDCDPITFEKRLNKLTDKLFHPYISLLTSYDLNRLTDHLKVHLVTSDLDVQLDSALEFERVWKGSLTIDIVDDLPHGFYAFSMLSKTAKDGAQICLDRLKQSINR